MKKKSNEKNYHSKFILEELEPRHLFSGGAEGVIPPPPVAAEAAVINANIEPVVESQNENDVTAIPNPDSAVELTNPDDNSSPISTTTAVSTDDNPNQIKDEVEDNTSPLLTETETQAYVSSQENEDIQPACIDAIDNSEVLLETDCPTAIDNFSEENESGQLINLLANDDFDSSSIISEEPLRRDFTDSMEVGGTLVNQPIVNNPTLTSETTSPEIEVCPSFEPSIVESTNEIIIVDSRVDDYQRIIDDITSQARIGVNFEVILLDGNKDGIVQITETLSQYKNLDAVHLISHGSDGSIDLGTNQLNLQTLIQNQEQIKSWGGAFADNGDLLIYGCNVAETQFGQSFIEYLSGLTNTEIAASTNETGSVQLGGDWNLEYQTGSIEAKSAISLSLQGQWDRLLAVESNGTVTSTQATNATSLTWSHTVNSGSNRALFVQIAIDGVGAGVNSVKYGTADLIRVGRTAGNHAVEIWALVNPNVGSNNVVVSFAGNTAAAAGASTFNGVDQTTAYENYTGNSGTTGILGGSGSVTVASAAGDQVIDVQYWKDALANTVGSGQTSQWSSTSVLSLAKGGSSVEAGASSVTMSGSSAIAFTNWSIGAVSIKASTNVDPVNSVPSAQTTNEDTTKVFSSANGNAITITDTDASGANNEITLTVTNGTLTLAGTTGLTFVAGDGTADSSMTIRGTASAINTALNGLSYAPTANYNGSATLTVSTKDSVLLSLDIDTSLKGRYTFNNTGALGSDTSPASGFNGTVVNGTSVNDATRGNVLSLAGNGYIQTTGHYGNPANVTLAAWVNLTTADTNGAMVISLGDSVGISLDNAGRLDGFYYNGTNWPQTFYTTTLAGAGWHHVAYTFDDAGNTATLYLDGVAVGSLATTDTISYTLGANSFIGKHGNGGTTWDFTGKIDDARVYSRVLTSDEIATLASDLTKTDTDTVAINVASVNDAPVNTVPSAQTTNEDTAKVFSSANGNQISVTDADAAGGSNEITLSVTNGTLTLAGTSGLTFTLGDGTADTTMTFRGTATDINTALNGLSYSPTANYNGSSTLTLRTLDSTLVALNIDANLQARYTFEGTANDVAAGTAQNGTLVGNATYTTDGTRGQVLTLDGSGDSVQITSTFGQPQNVTIGGWINLSSGTGRKEFISIDDRVHIALDDVGGVKGSVQVSAGVWTDLNSNQFIAGTGWHHVMYVFNGASDVHTLYIDGVAVASATNTNTIYYTGATTTYIGQHPTNTAWNINGKVDDVRIYDRSLSGSEVANLAADLSLIDTDTVAVTVTAVNDAPTDLYSIRGISESSLVGVYGFNNAANLGRDDAGNNAPITFYGNPGQTTGPTGTGALDLAGGSSGQYADITGITTGGAMTFAGSVRFDSTGDWQRVFDFGQSGATGLGNIYVARYGGSNDLTFTIEKDSGSGVISYRSLATNVITNGTWLHFTATVDASGTMKLYINGSLALNPEATITGVAPDTGIRTNNYIGKSAFTTNDAFFDGAIDNLVIANGAMSAANVAALYQQTTGFSIAENSANTTVVGTVVGFDVDASANPTYSLTDSAGGRFAINSTNGTITVANGSLLDYENATSHNITVRVTDTGGLTYDETFTVNLTNVYEAPSATNLTASETYTEDSTLNLTDIVITRGDNASVTATLTLSNTSAGSLNTATSGAVTSTYNAGTGVWTASGTVADVNALLAGLTFAPAANFNSAFTIATSVSDGTTTITGIKTMTGTAVNDVPVFSGLDNTPTFIENGTAVVLDNNVTVSDSELSPTNSFSGTSLVLRRNGGDNSQDVFSASGTLSSLTQGGNLVVGGITVGNVITNSGGLLVLSFNGNATNALVNSVLQQIAYSNTSDTPPASVQINWSFNDVNGGAQGTGGMGIATGSTTVNITAVNDAPTATNLSAAETYTEDTTLNLTDIVISDVDSATVTATLTLSNTAAGSLNTATSGLVTSTYNSGTGVWTASGAIADVNALLAGLTFTPAANFNSSFTIATSVNDGVAAAITGTKTMTGTAVNDAPSDIVVTRFLSDLGDAGKNIYSLTLDKDHGGVLPIVIDGTVYSKGLATHPGPLASPNPEGNQYGYVDYNINGATTFKATIGINDYNTGTASPYGSVRFYVYVDGSLKYSSAEINSDSAPIDLNIDLTGGSTLRLAVDNGAVGSNSFDHGVWGNARLEGGSIALNSVAENAANSTIVGSVVGSDIDINSNWSYSLTDNAGGRFAINASTGQITVANGALLDYESATSHSITVQVTDSNGASYSEAISVALTNVVESPIVTNGSAGQNYTEDTPLSLTPITITRGDSAAVTVTLTLSNPAAGTLNTATSGAVTSSYETNTGVWTANGAIVDINNLLAGLTFTPAANFNSNFTIATSVSDGLTAAVTGSKAMTGIAVNDAPLQRNGDLITLSDTDEDTISSPVYVSSLLSSSVWNDVDAGALGGIAVTNATGNGHWEYSTDGLTWTVIGSVSSSNALLLDYNSQIHYVPDNIKGENVSFDFKAWDQTSGIASTNSQASYASTAISGGSSAFSIGTENVSRNVTDVNDAPTATNLSAPETYTEDNALNLTDIFISDVDSATVTATLTLSNTSAGSLNTGSLGAVTSTFDTGTGVWSASGAVADVNALLAGLTFTPAVNFNSDFTIVTSISDGLSAAVTGIKSMTGIAVNDAPIINSNAGGASASVTINENSSAVTTVTASDIDGTALTYSISGGADASKFVINNVTGTLSFVNAPNYESPTDSDGNNVYEVIVQVSDGSLMDTQTITVTITNIDDTAPSITSGGVATAINENSGAGQTIYTATSTDSGDIATGSTSYSLSDADAALFSIDAITGAVTLLANPNYEAKASYSFTVTATDAAGNASAAQTVTLGINNLDEVAPTITSGSIATAINENSGAGQVIYTATSTDSGDIASGSTSYSLSGADAALFSIDASTGAVTLTGNPDFEAKASYSFSVTATDAAGNASAAQVVTLAITNLDEVAPSITSGGVATAINENSGAGQVIYTATSTDSGDIATGSTSYSLGGTDAALFSIDAITGAVTLLANPDFETKASYSFSVTATDAAGNASAAQTVTLGINNLDEVTPTITSGSIATAINENSGAGQVIYTATSTDSGDIASGSTSYSLSGADAALFSIDASTGAVTLTGNPDFEAKASYSFSVTATDAAGNASAAQVVTLAITNLDEVAPSITSGGVATAINENSGAGQVIYTATSTDSGDIASGSTSYSLGGTDAALFSIDAITGAVTLLANPSYEAKASYSFTVTATDAAGNASAAQTVTLGINNLDEVAPTITSGSIATAINENSGAGQVIYTATSTDSGDIANGSTSYSLSGADAALFSIDAITGAVTLLANPDFETKASYSFSVTATDAAGNASAAQTVTLGINNLDEVAPTITSGSIATAINENSGAGQVIYTATSTDSGDTASGSTSYSLGGADAALFSIDASTGAVTLTGNPDFEAKASYSFSVTATDAAGNASAAQAVTLAVTNLDEVAPSITSGGVATAINENSGAGQVIYTASSTDSGDTASGSTSYSLGGADAALFSIDASTGAVTLLANPNYEAKASYSFTVTATDAAGNASAAQTVTLGINNLDEVAPTITSGSIATAINENSGAGQVIYTATSTDSGDIASGSTSYSLSGADAALFSIDAITGAVTLLANPNYEAKASYSFTVTATDAAGNASAAQTVTLGINNLDEVASTITSGSIATAINENSGAGQVIYTATSTDSGDIASGSTSYSLNGADAALFSIDASTGAVTLLANPDFETKASYSFSVTATDAAGNASAAQNVKLAVNNLDELSTGSLKIKGIFALGETLQVSQNLTDPDGIDEISFIWKADGVIVGTGSSYKLTESDLGKVITVVANYTDGFGSNASFVSSNLTRVSDPSPPFLPNTQSLKLASLKDDVENPSINLHPINLPEENTYKNDGSKNDSTDINKEVPVISNLEMYVETLIKKLEQSNNGNSDILSFTEADSQDSSSKRVLHTIYNRNVSNSVKNTENTIIAAEEKSFEDNMVRIRHQLDRMNSSEDLKQIDVQIMLGTTAALTAGFVSWLLRGGALLTSFLSTVPLFSRFDPVPILRASKKEALIIRKNEEIVEDEIVLNSEEVIDEVQTGKNLKSNKINKS